MPTLDEVYAKFGEVSEAAQLLETEIGTLLLASRANELVSLADDPADHTLDSPFVVDSVAARKNLDEINASMLGRLTIAFGSHARPDQFDELSLSTALKERNRLAHHFYRQHNFRRNSDAGRAIMMQDLESMHNTILNVYKAVSPREPRSSLRSHPACPAALSARPRTGRSWPASALAHGTAPGPSTRPWLPASWSTRPGNDSVRAPSYAAHSSAHAGPRTSPDTRSPRRPSRLSPGPRSP